MDCRTDTPVCRVCLLPEPVEQFRSHLRETFNTIIGNPEENIDGSRPDCICSTCCVALEKFETFILKCRSNRHRISVVYENFQSICRICLADEDVQPFDLDAQKVFKSVLASEDVFDAELSQSVCETCNSTLYDLEFFIEKCKNNEETYRTRHLNTIRDGVGVKKEVPDTQVIAPVQVKSEVLDIGDVSIKEEVTETYTPIPDVEDKPYVCRHCDDLFCTVPALLRHTKRYHGATVDPCKERVGTEGKYRCPDPQCEAAFYMKKHLLQHVATHANRTFYKCPICEKPFQTETQLNTHRKVHKPEELRKPTAPFLCPYCRRGFYMKSKFESHVYSHTGEGTFKCPLCKKSYVHPSTLNRHMLSHNKLNKDHVTTHTGQKPFLCPHCDKSFRTRYLLNHHKVVHAEKPPPHLEPQQADASFECPHCGKKLAARQSFRDHLSTHKTVKTWLCYYCTGTFGNGIALMVHIEQCHQYEDHHPCPYCKKRLYTRRNLSMHMARHVEHKKHKCEHCGKAYFRKDNLRRHQVVHQS